MTLPIGNRRDGFANLKKINSQITPFTFVMYFLFFISYIDCLT